MVSIELLSFVVFLIAVVLYLVIDRKNIQAYGPLFMRKTIRGKNFIINTGVRFRRFWNVIGTIAVISGFIGSIYIIYNLLGMLYFSISTLSTVPGVGLVLPSPTTIVTGGFIGVPLWFWLISIILLLVVHEGLHGIIAASQKMKIKTLGWILFIVLPIGAFVEPIEKDVLKKKLMPQLRFYAAGSFANFVLAFFVGLILAPLVIGPATMTGMGLQIYPEANFPFANNTEIIDISESFNPNLNVKFFVREFNGFHIQDYDSAKQTLENMDIKPWETVDLNLDVFYGNNKDNIDISLVAVENPSNTSKGYIGILFSSQVSYVVKDELLPYRSVLFFLADMFLWISIINLGVGLFNMLPLGPLDGKRMWEAVLKQYYPKRAKIIMRVVQFIMLFVLLAILVPAILSNFI